MKAKTARPDRTRDSILAELEHEVEEAVRKARRRLEALPQPPA